VHVGTASINICRHEHICHEFVRVQTISVTENNVYKKTYALACVRVRRLLNSNCFYLSMFTAFILSSVCIFIFRCFFPVSISLFCCTFYLHVCRLIFVRSGLCVSIFFVSVERFVLIPRMSVSREYHTFVRTRTRTR